MPIDRAHFRKWMQEDSVLCGLEYVGTVECLYNGQVGAGAFVRYLEVWRRNFKGCNFHGFVDKHLSAKIKQAK